MYFSLQPELREISPEEAAENELAVGYIEKDELADAILRFGFTDTSAEECLNERDNYRNAIEIYDGYTFGMVNIVNVRNVYENSDRLAFFFRENLLLVVSLRDDDGSTRQTFMDALKRYKPTVVTMEKVIFAILESTIKKDSTELEMTERHINALEELVAKNQDPQKLSACLYDLKKRLLILRSYYEQIIDIGEGLEENENELFTEDALHYFALLTQKAERLSGTVSMLCDELNQLQNSHQAAMDYRLNETMKLLTVITIICLPLTLIVGWYGMNFPNMFLINSDVGYPIVCVCCVVIVSGLLVFFKKKGML